MVFIDYCHQIIDAYKKEGDFIEERKLAIRLGLDHNKPLFSTHTFYTPINEHELLRYFKNHYKNPIPDSILEFYRFSNGATLFTAKIEHREVQYFAHPCFCIFGLPRNSTTWNPFDIRIEDLARGNKISSKWLKIGIFELPDDFERYDIFIDTINKNIYLTKTKQNEILKHFDSLDECLCFVFDQLKTFDYSHLFKPSY